MNPSRNGPCYCGSGKKYKKCCLRTDEVVDFQKAAEKKALEKIFQKMERFLESQDWEDDLEAAENIFSCELEDHDEDNRDSLYQKLDQDNFLNWFFLDYFIDDDFRPIDRFLTGLQDDPGSKELQIAKLLQNSYVSLYEIFKIIPHKGLGLRDIFTGREFFISNKDDFSDMTQGLLLTARLITIEDRSYPVDMGFFFLPSEVPLIQELARRTRNELSEKQKRKISQEKFLKIMGAIFFNLYYLEHAKALQPEEDYPEKADRLKNHILYQADHLEYPEELDQEMKPEEIEEYFRDWLDERQPVLEGHTPREAAEIPDLRERLVWLLKEVEYFERLNRKQNSYDIDLLKRELKLI